MYFVSLFDAVWCESYCLFTPSCNHRRSGESQFFEWTQEKMKKNLIWNAVGQINRQSAFIFKHFKTCVTFDFYTLKKITLISDFLMNIQVIKLNLWHTVWSLLKVLYESSLSWRCPAGGALAVILSVIQLPLIFSFLSFGLQPLAVVLPVLCSLTELGLTVNNPVLLLLQVLAGIALKLQFMRVKFIHRTRDLQERRISGINSVSIKLCGKFEENVSQKM